ncbi:MAG: hypothetical protein AAF456_05830 [Planctomycetota bacterium]
MLSKWSLKQIAAVTCACAFLTSWTVTALAIQDDATPVNSADASVASIGQPEAVVGPNGATVDDFPPQLDVIYLRSGGQIHGEAREITGESRPYWLVTTESGGILKLDSRVVDRIKFAEDEYAAQIGAMDPESAADHWTMYEWCDNQERSSSRFKQEMNFHLQRICDLDPNDEKARKLLDLELDDTTGRWVRPEQRYANHGYVKIIGGYVPEMFLDIYEYENDEKTQVNNREREFTGWLRSLRTETDERLMTEQLFAIVDETMIPAVYEKAKEEPNLRLRMLLVDAIGRVPGVTAANSLVHFAVRDPARSIRERALILLKQDQYNQHAAAMKAAGFLSDENNDYVEQAGFVIGELGSPATTLSLIEALITIHTPPRDPNAPAPGSINFGSDSLGGTGLSTGGNAPPRPQPFYNRNVLSALTRITERSTGYSDDPFNKDGWRRWYTETHTISDIDVRRDE